MIEEGLSRVEITAGDGPYKRFLVPGRVMEAYRLSALARRMTVQSVIVETEQMLLRMPRGEN